MSNSPLVSYTRVVKNSTNPRQDTIKKITIHHMAGNLSLQTLGNIFASRGSSANYGIDNQGDIGMYVEEKNRAWTSSSRDNDNQAVTIEVANDENGGDWHVSDKALASLVNLCIDICKRNGIKKINFTGDKSGNLTQHNYFVATACPGPYLKSKFPYIAEQINNALAPKANDVELGLTEHVVKSGDTLSGIAKKYNTTVAKLANINGIIDVNKIYPGQKIRINNVEIYVVKKGDTLSAIAKKYGTTYQELALINKLVNPNEIYPGQKLKITGGTPAPAPVKTLKIGSKVKVTGSRYATGEKIPSWVKKETLTVKQLKSDRVLLKEIVSWVYIKDIKLV